MSEQLLFNSYVEALITRAYPDRLTPQLKQRLRAHELDLDAKLHPGYPARLLAPWLQVMADELFPGQPLEQAQEAIGRRFIAGWKETLMGRAIMPLVKLLPARRALGRMERNFRATDNFTRITLRDVGLTAIELQFEEINGVPAYYLGLLDEGATISGAKVPRCRLLRVHAPGATFVCEWEE